ncbi:hypothetical protein Gotur_006182, partial [Gossypium turneri]
SITAIKTYFEESCLSISPNLEFPILFFFLKLPNTYPIRKIFETQQETYENSERISLVSSFMTCLFLGAYACIDAIDGAGMNLMDIKKRAWSKVAVELAPAHAVAGSIASYFAGSINVFSGISS